MQFVVVVGNGRKRFPLVQFAFRVGAQGDDGSDGLGLRGLPKLRRSRTGGGYTQFSGPGAKVQRKTLK